MSETYFVGAILAIIGGFLDAYTFIIRGNVFANAQTGNIVLFGIRLAEKKYMNALHYLIPILSFVIGILVAETIKNRYKQSTNIHWRQIIILIECIAIFIVGCIPKGDFNWVANVMVSFVCSLQVQSFRKVNDISCATTMCTGNLRSAIEQLSNYKYTKDKTRLDSSLQYFGIILFFILGASIGAVLTNLLDIKSVFICCAGLVFVLLVMFVKHNE